MFRTSLLALLPAAALAASGAIEGKVTLDGPAPALAALKVTKDQKSCGNERPNESALVSADGSLGNVVVHLRGMKGAVNPVSGAIIDQRACQYIPHIQAVTVGTRVAVINNDAVLHNVHASVGPKTVFNLAMPIKGLSMFQACTHPGLMKLTCDAGHPWMLAYVWVFEHPYYAITAADGSYRLVDVPPGEYELEFWHEPIDGKGEGVKKISKVTVAEGERVRVDTTLKL